MKSFAYTVLVVSMSLCSPHRLMAETSAPPNANDAFEYTLTMLCNGYITQIHEAKGDDHRKKQPARAYYQLLFAMWYGTKHPLGAKVVKLDLKGYVYAFQRFSRKENFGNLIDNEDPIGWNHLPAGIDKQSMIDFMGGVDYYTWVLQETKDTKTYKKAVQEFRDYMVTVNPKGLD